MDFAELLKTEIIFNNRLLHVEDEIDPRVLTQNSILHGRVIYILEEEEIEETASKMEKRLRTAKDEMWNRWRTEYVRTLRERRDITQKKQYYPEFGGVVLVVSDSKNKHEWHHGLVCEHLQGKDGVVLGVRMIVRDKIWERPIQLVCHLEIRSTMTLEELNKRLVVAYNKEHPEVEVTRPRRLAKAEVCENIARIAEDEERF